MNLFPYGWMNSRAKAFFFPCKPHPKGNEYNSICCGESGIVYSWNIVEGRYHPIPTRRPQFETSRNMKTVGLVLWLTRAIWITCKTVIMDSGSFVFKVLLEKGIVGFMEVYRGKIGTIGLRGFMEMLLTSTSSRKCLWCEMSKWQMGWERV